VAATFGSGLSYACVVDVGDQKTSVSCVEDGICHPNTRVIFFVRFLDNYNSVYWSMKRVNILNCCVGKTGVWRR
jgi:actin-related protein 8